MNVQLNRVSRPGLRRLFTFGGIALLLLALVIPAKAESLYKNEKFKFSIRVPVPESTSITSPYQLITMPLPAENGFSTNINVQIQPFTGSPEEYMRISREGLQQMGVKIVTEKSGNGWIMLEAEGEVQGFQLHFYAKAWITSERTYLVTATCPVAEWPAKKGELIDCVESFKTW